MSEPTHSDSTAGTPGEVDQHAMLFAHLVMELSNTASMFLGKVPHPETGKPLKDLQAARLFIDQLEMLEAKTKGNLSKEESSFLKQTLMTLRLGFVEAVDSAEPKQEQPPASTPAKEPIPTEQKTGPDTKTAKEENRVKFSKKY